MQLININFHGLPMSCDAMIVTSSNTIGICACLVVSQKQTHKQHVMNTAANRVN